MSETAVITEYEHKARARKALALADVFTAQGARASTVAQLDDAGWKIAAAVAQVRMPSDTTRSLVVDLLAHRQRMTDPFRDLPECTAPAPFPVVCAPCFAPIPGSGHQECTGETERGLPCSCFCRAHPARHGLRVVR